VASQINHTTVEKLRAHDESAFDEVYEHYKNLLYVIIYSIIKNEQLSQDALQDTFLKMYQNINKLKQNSKFHSWLIMIAKNTALNYLKQVKETPIEDTILENVVSEEDNFISLWHPQLNEFENLIIAYKIVYELPFALIARLIDKPLTSVYVIYQKALKTLKTVYEESEATL